MITRKKYKQRILTPTQLHDVWEVGEVEEITEEVKRVMKSMGMETDEVERALPKKEVERGS